MKYTIKYLKCATIVILVTIVILSLFTGVLLMFVGLCATLYDKNPEYLILVAIGVFLGFVGFVAIDASEWILNNW